MLSYVGITALLSTGLTSLLKKAASIIGLTPGGFEIKNQEVSNSVQTVICVHRCESFE